MRGKLLGTLMLIALLLPACAPADVNTSRAPVDDGSITLTLGAYTTPREAYSQIIPLFQAHWLQTSGQTVTFEESYLGSGAQSRAIVEGFEADVAALSLEADITRIEDAGLISHNWRDTPAGGMISNSIVVIGVREGNPLNIQDWVDLARPGLEILTPNPQTSGGAQWNILAIYGAAKRGFVEGVPAGNDAAAQAFLELVLKNVTVMDKGARDSITNFEKGVGDVIITYENEILVGKKSRQHYDYVIPKSTILIENPVAVIDANVDRHGTRPVAEAFAAFLLTREAQEIFAEYGLRPVGPAATAIDTGRFPPVPDLFTIEEFGGWSQATPAFFGEAGIFTIAIANVQRAS
ncbi:MAG: sulfate ABC transporter substrate-binding protein [Anaerolineae bacterium]